MNPRRLLYLVVKSGLRGVHGSGAGGGGGEPQSRLLDGMLTLRRSSQTGNAS